ncbi:alpha-hydroxy acid oxidase [Gluconacetobacter asukensis]|uniref:Alpha-hydroxy-acid oxidizing protein n=1 Tax=Gluconacetobacter asukensis TaxID=1017181 RepID=A0A7W4J0C8_9PROT|nr:alpha-hydroxy acid oxidase [Gluconacetobacter asukensis]MBB2172351.1 alpha-hydroxy-acid oxidizing protein [Gluconacetobacter asukensis]
MIVSVDQLRQAARGTLPRWLFDYVDGGAYSEATLRRNRDALAERHLLPFVLRGVARPDAGASILGVRQPFPIGLAPVGMAGMLDAQGEIAAARAATALGVQMCVSHFSICSIEEIARAVDPAFLMFQLYIFRDRAVTEDMVRRAWAAGVRTLVVTVDTPVTPLRERDVRNGFRQLSRLSLRHIGQMLPRPGWTWRMVRRGHCVIGNLVPYDMGTTLFSQAAAISRSLDPAIGWDDMAWLRTIWKGRLVVKGVMQPADVATCADLGLDGVVLSNHGGRQLDGSASAVDVLEAGIRAANARIQILVDGGFRYGGDVAKALMLGAAGVMIGRPWAYALAANGEKGVTDVLKYFRDGLLSTMTLLGAADLGALRGGRKSLLLEARQTTSFDEE